MIKNKNNLLVLVMASSLFMISSHSCIYQEETLDELRQIAAESRASRANANQNAVQEFVAVKVVNLENFLNEIKVFVDSSDYSAFIASLINVGCGGLKQGISRNYCDYNFLCERLRYMHLESCV